MTVARSSYLHSGIFYTDKMVSLYWIRAPSISVDVPAYVGVRYVLYGGINIAFELI